MGFLEDTYKFIDFDLGTIPGFQIKHLFDLGNDLSFKLMVD
jgi:hypothetical protein